MSFWSTLNPIHDASAAWHATDKALHTDEKAIEDGAKGFENALKDAGKDAAKVVKNMSPSQLGHTALDIVGMVPVIGTVANLANAGWYAAQGDWADAAWSAAAAIPIEGDLADAAKLGKDGVEIGEDAANAEKVVKDGTEVERGVEDGAEIDKPAVGDAGSAPKAEGPGARFADEAKLQDHFGKHGGDFGAKTEAEYQQQADTFLTGPKASSVLEKTRPNDDVVRYDQATEEFGVVSKDGIIRTYFKPDPQIHGKPTNLDYFNDQ